MNKTFIIAEAGVNHNGCIERAKKLIDVAAASGANAVKFQTFKADKLVTKNAPKAKYQTLNYPETESQFNMLQRLELNAENHLTLHAYSKKQNIIFLSTPFDVDSVDLLTKTLNLPLLKIASGEITNGPLLLKSAQNLKPIILSTGMSTLGDIEIALGVLAFGYLQLPLPANHANFSKAYRSLKGQAALREKVSLLHCTSEYPAAFAEVNLNVLAMLHSAFNLPVGYSDHTPGIEIAIAAVALGASIIEKHFTLDKTLPGPDHQASISPEELFSMVKAIRNVELSLGISQKFPNCNEINNQAIARKSLVSLKTISKGETFNAENLGLKRPGNGLSGMHYWEKLGKLSEYNYNENDLIK